MDTLGEIRKELEKTLTPERYSHSIAVMERAEELANIYQVDIQTAKLVGLAHDIAKQFSKEESFTYATQHQIPIDLEEQRNPSLLHGKIGAHISKEKYHFTQEMQDAIIFHTTGRPHMTLLEKIIFIADKTEKTRPFPDLEYICKLAEENLEEALLYIYEKTIQKCIDKRQILHPLTVEARNELIFQKMLN